MRGLINRAETFVVISIFAIIALVYAGWLVGGNMDRCVLSTANSVAGAASEVGVEPPNGGGALLSEPLRQPGGLAGAGMVEVLVVRHTGEPLARTDVCLSVRRSGNGEGDWREVRRCETGADGRVFFGGVNPSECWDPLLPELLVSVATSGLRCDNRVISLSDCPCLVVMRVAPFGSIGVKLWQAPNRRNLWTLPLLVRKGSRESHEHWYSTHVVDEATLAVDVGERWLLSAPGLGCVEVVGPRTDGEIVSAELCGENARGLVIGLLLTNGEVARDVKVRLDFGHRVIDGRTGGDACIVIPLEECARAATVTAYTDSDVPVGVVQVAVPGCEVPAGRHLEWLRLGTVSCLVSGRVTDIETGMGLEGARVQWRSGDPRDQGGLVRTGSSGEFACYGEPCKDVSLAVTTASHRTREVVVVAPAVEVEVQLASMAECRYDILHDRGLDTRCIVADATHCGTGRVERAGVEQHVDSCSVVFRKLEAGDYDIAIRMDALGAVSRSWRERVGDSQKVCRVVDIRGKISICDLHIHAAGPEMSVPGRLFVRSARADAWTSIGVGASMRMPIGPEDKIEAIVIVDGHLPARVQLRAGVVHLNPDPCQCVTVQLTGMPPMDDEARVRVSLVQIERKEPLLELLGVGEIVASMGVRVDDVEAGLRPLLDDGIESGVVATVAVKELAGRFRLPGRGRYAVAVFVMGKDGVWRLVPNWSHENFEAWGGAEMWVRCQVDADSVARLLTAGPG